MTTRLDHTGDLTADLGPLAAGVVEVNAVLDRMLAAADGPVAPEACAGLVADLERIRRRVDALKLRLVARGETAAAAKRDGFCDRGAWLARQNRTTRPDAARQARLADDLGDAPATGTAFAHGALSAEHAGVITDALGKLPTRVTPAQRAAVEADLIAKASRFDPAQLRRAARRALETIEPDPVVVDAHEDTQIAAEEDAAYEKARFTFHHHDDGTVTGHFTVPASAFAFLHKILEAMTAPRNSRSRGAERSGMPTEWATRRGQAFTELLGHLPTDHLHNKSSATVIVHLRDDVLRGALAAAGLDTAGTISSGEARRLACTAGLLPAVLGGRSLPLDLGTEQRLFTMAQRLALSTRHTSCAADGCERPFAWCEIHHRQPWSHGGRTDLDNAVPLCGWHHRRAHAT